LWLKLALSSTSKFQHLNLRKNKICVSKISHAVQPARAVGQVITTYLSQ